MPLCSTTSRYSGISLQRQKSSTNRPEPSAGSIVIASGPGCARSRSTPAASRSTSSAARKPGRYTAPSRRNASTCSFVGPRPPITPSPGIPDVVDIPAVPLLDLHQRRHGVAHARLEHVPLVAERELVDVRQLLVRIEALDLAEQRDRPAPVVAVDHGQCDPRLPLHVRQPLPAAIHVRAGTCSPVHMYHVVAACGDPSGRTVETMPGRRSLMKSTTSAAAGPSAWRQSRATPEPPRP